jgi:hypothetical protein
MNLKIKLSTLPLFLSFTFFAQAKIKNQPEANYFKKVIKTCTSLDITKEKALSYKLIRSSISKSIADTLKKFDWYLVGTFDFFNSNYKNHFADTSKLFGEGQHKLDITRYFKNGDMVNFSLKKNNSTPWAVYSLYDKKDNLKFSITSLDGITMRVTNRVGQQTYQQVVYYKDKLLIIDITKTETMYDKSEKYRYVFYGMPQLFNWNFGE